MANTSVTAIINLSPGYTFNVPSVSGVFQGPTFNQNVIFNRTAANSANITLTVTKIPSGTKIFFVLIEPETQITGATPPPDGSFVIGTVIITVNNSTPVSTGSFQLLIAEFLGSYVISGQGNINVACLHGSSMIQMREGSKRLDQIKEGDEVLSHSCSGEQEYTQVKGVAQCWLSFMGVDHDAIIFEKDSLGDNEPSQQLIIDPGHPMCTRKKFLEKGSDALRPAATFWEELKEDKVYTKKWTDVFVQDEPSVRYDLILDEPFNTYVANGIVVRSKGYKDHRYKDLV